MDLKRISQGLQNDSMLVAKRFAKEAIKRKQEIDFKKVDPYLAKILSKLKIRADRNIAEDVLMYSVLLQNYVLWKKNQIINH